MKRIILLLSLLVLFQVSGIYAQSLNDYVLEQRGDTLVVKDDFDMGESNALFNLLQADSLNVPAGRVYMLHKNGYYGLVNTPTTAATRKVTIVGENMGLLKTYEGSDLAPILTGAVWEGGTSTGGLTSGNDLEVKNISISIGNSAGGIGWNWFGHAAANQRLTVDNCILEHTLWVMFVPGTNCKTYIRNNYFVNMTGQSCRRNGGVVDMFTTQDTLLVENNTHVMAQGMIYKSRNYLINRMIFNHNTFVNCAGVIFMSLGFQNNASVTNNMFINCQVQGYSGDKNMDPGESDLDAAMPMGLINIASLDSTGYSANDLKFYVDNNLIYWDPKFNDLISYFNTNAVGGYTTWMDQKITMNSRTQGMFDDDATYPYLVEDGWITGKKPAFADPKDLFDAQQQVIYDYAKVKADPNATEIMPEWRLINTPVQDNFTYADFPIPVDLSYTDSDLQTAAWGFPVGDVNWFPAKYADWTAQKADEYSKIHTALTTGVRVPTAVETVVGPAKEFKLSQNFPNPFNPTTTINFSLPKDGFVTLKVYNAIGQEVATLLNGFRKAQSYNVEFDASNLPSGVYIYKVQADNNTISKKMVLMK